MYTLEQLAADARAAMDADPGPGGRDGLRACVARACADPEFVAAVFEDNRDDRRVIYEDEKHGFVILAHYFEGARESMPHDVSAAAPFAPSFEHEGSGCTARHQLGDLRPSSRSHGDDGLGKD